MSCTRWWAPARPKVRSTPLTSSSPPSRAAKSSASAPPLRPSSASLLRRTGRSSAASGRQGPAAERGRCRQDSVRNQGPLREVPRRRLHRRCHRDGRLHLQPLHSRPLPADKAIDLIDEAGARVKLRQTTLPADLADIQKRIKFIVHRMETPSPTTSSRRRASTPTRSVRSARTCVSCAKSTTSTTPPPAAVTKDDIEDVVVALDRRAHDLHQGEEIAKLLRTRKSCTSASSARRSPFPRWPALSAVPVPG